MDDNNGMPKINPSLDVTSIRDKVEVSEGDDIEGLTPNSRMTDVEYATGKCFKVVRVKDMVGSYLLDPDEVMKYIMVAATHYTESGWDARYSDENREVERLYLRQVASEEPLVELDDDKYEMELLYPFEVRGNTIEDISFPRPTDTLIIVPDKNKSQDPLLNNVYKVRSLTGLRRREVMEMSIVDFNGITATFL